jgi:hypothetical protein
MAIDTVHVWPSGCSAILVILELKAALEAVCARGLCDKRSNMRQDSLDQNNDQGLQIR